jgi:hypothetical protein
MARVSFYCEHCGKAVKARDKICKSCGRFFTKVKCPKCSFEGPGEQFIMGCPVCGFQGKGHDLNRGKNDIEIYDLDYIKHGMPLMSVGSESDEKGGKEIIQKKKPFPFKQWAVGLTLAVLGAILLYFLVR